MKKTVWLLLLLIMGLPTGTLAIEPLFQDISLNKSQAANVQTHMEKPFVERARLILADSNRFLKEPQILFNLFDDAVWVVNKESMKKQPGGFTWTGTVRGSDESRVVLVSQGGLIAANLISSSSMYQVRPAPGGLHIIRQIQQEGFPESRQSFPDSLPKSAGVQKNPTDDFMVFDLLVAYTPQAKESSENLGLEIRLAMTETNDAYEQSGISQRLRLVRRLEVDFEGSGDMLDDLELLQGYNDSFMDEVHNERSAACADLVMLITETGGYCGYAYQMGNPVSSFEAWAFSVVKRSCATGNYSFGHELGHNMGLRHDWYVDDNIYPYKYAHGYVSTENRWRTVMSYNTECQDQGFYCSRIPRFSNPDATYDGVPTGVSETLPQPADNRLALSGTAPVVANFRDSSICLRDLILVALETEEVVGSAMITWETAEENGILSYHIVRADSADGPFERITTDPVPARWAGTENAIYQHLDETVEDGQEYWYQLEAIHSLGGSEFFGPVNILIPEPIEPVSGCNAVRIGHDDASLVIGITLVIGLGLWLGLRRRKR